MEIVSYKKQLLEKLLAIAQSKEIEAKENSQKAQKRANEEEGRMQSRYSTFKEEGQYLAGGLKGLSESYKAAVSLVRSMMNEDIKENSRVESLSIVDVEFEDVAVAKFFIFPVLGGEKIDDLTIINTNAPIAKALLRKEAGDEFILTIDNKTRRGEIINVQ